MRYRKSNIILKTFNSALIDLPTPISITYLWNYGSLLGLCLLIQIISGIFLAMFYSSDISVAFNSVIHILRDVNYGWLLKYIHANGASFFFICVYIHIARGMYFSSYLKKKLWNVGVVIFLFMMLIAFIGYVLPWGQMSFWGATVITNFVSAVPYIGMTILEWIWGGFSVGNATLGRFFSFHYLFPFVILALVILHVIFLHEHGSNNPLGINAQVDKIVFPYFIIKDIYSLVWFGFIYAYYVFFEPNTLGHPDNYIPANPMVTPTHIVPEWYFLPFYAILRSVPNKALGVVLLMASIFILIVLPFYGRSAIRSNSFRPFYKILFWFFVADCLLLGWIGGKPIEAPFYALGQYFTVFYFAYFLIFLPNLQKIEYTLLQKK